MHNLNEPLGDEDGVFGCQDICLKDLPLQSKIAYLRRMMLKISEKLRSHLSKN